MKKLLLLALLFPIASFAEWTKVAENRMAAMYIEFESVKESDGYVYYWQITNFIKPTEGGHLSAKILYEVDCKTPRKTRWLSFASYDREMAKGSDDYILNTPDEWIYVAPETTHELIVDTVCQFTELKS